MTTNPGTESALKGDWLHAISVIAVIGTLIALSTFLLVSAIPVCGRTLPGLGQLKPTP